MGNPQLENGYTRIANEIIDKLCRLNLTGCEWRILWFIFRKTYGYQKKQDKISFSQFSDATGIDRGNVNRTLKSLIKKGLIFKIEGKINFYRFNKCFYDFSVVKAEYSDVVGVVKDVVGVVKAEYTSVVKAEYNKRKKENNKRNISEPSSPTITQSWQYLAQETIKTLKATKISSIYKCFKENEFKAKIAFLDTRELGRENPEKLNEKYFFAIFNDLTKKTN